MPYVIGCPEPTARQALVDAAIKFCEESNVLRQTLDPLTTIPGVATYDIELPAQHQLSRLLRVRGANGLNYTVAEPGATPTAQVGPPTAFFVTREDGLFTLHLSPAPQAAQEFTIEAALEPTRTATKFANDLGSHWADHVIHGALARLYAIPDQPFSDPVRAANAMTQFLSEARWARAEGNLSRVRGSLRVQTRPLA